MLPYTHICFAGDVLGTVTNEIALGSVFPDTVIAGFLEHSDTHQRSGDIHKYLTRIGVFNDFSHAVITHASDLKGMDYYCDEKYMNFEKGYAFEMARPLVDKVVKTCRIPERMGWWKAHNFIEMATELWFYKNRPEYRSYLEKALSDGDLIMALSQILAPFYGISTAKMAMSFPIYGEFVLMEEVTSLQLAAKYHKQTVRKHGIDIDIHGTAEIIEESLESIEKTLPEFLKTCEHNVKLVIEKLIENE